MKPETAFAGFRDWLAPLGAILKGFIWEYSNTSQIVRRYFAKWALNPECKGEMQGYGTVTRETGLAPGSNWARFSAHLAEYPAFNMECKMEHVLATLESVVSPAALAAGTSPSLTVGKINVGKVLYDLYSEIDDKANTAVVRIIELAYEYTSAEFREAVKGAQEMATAQDAATGFKAREGAKGAELYGPARRNINTRMSEAKQIFGVAKMAPNVVKEKGYFSALTASRDWLGEKGMKWDGARALTTEEKKSKKQQKADQEAILAAQKVLPQHQGESIAQYMVRVAAKAEAIKESLAIEQVLKQIQGLEEIASEDDVLSAVFEYIRGKGPDVMEACAKQLEEQAAEDRSKMDKQSVKAPV